MDSRGLLLISGPHRVTVGLLPWGDHKTGLLLLLRHTDRFSRNVRGTIGTLPLPLQPRHPQRTLLHGNSHSPSPLPHRTAACLPHSPCLQPLAKLSLVLQASFTPLCS